MVPDVPPRSARRPPAPPGRVTETDGISPFTNVSKGAILEVRPGIRLGRGVEGICKMGFTPDMVRASIDTKYTARVFLDFILTGNVSVFDRAVFEYATEPHTFSHDDTLTDNVIDVWGMLDSAYCALLEMEADPAYRDRWLLVHETFLEVKEEYDMVEDWLAGDE